MQKPTEIRNDAYWCNCCQHKAGRFCAMAVPYYGSSLNCKYFMETVRKKREQSQMTQMKRLMKRTLVEVL